MYERFTDRARKVMSLAQKEAVDFDHTVIDTEHLLLGLIAEGSGVAASILLRIFDVTYRKARLETKKVSPYGRTLSSPQLPLSPQIEKVIEYAREEAQALKHNYVGTEHLLLGLLREEESHAVQILKNLGVPPSECRNEVLLLLGHGFE